MRMQRSIAVIAGVCSLLVIPFTASAQQPAPIWKVGQEWRLLVRPYSRGWMVAHSSPRDNERALIPRADREFHVKARVIDVMSRGDHERVTIQFTAESDAPVIDSTNPPRADVVRTQEYTLTLDAQTWQVVELEGKPEVSSNQVLAGGDCRAILTPGWLPIEWVIARADLENLAERTELLNSPDFRPTLERPTPSGALRRTVCPEKDGNLRISVAEVDLLPRKKSGEPPKEAMREVEQVWHPGDRWWRSFRRYSGGHICMEAFLASDPNGSGKPIELPTRRPIGRPVAASGPMWTVGDAWRFLVKDRHVNTEVEMKARVTALVKEDGRECARIVFIAGDDVPEMCADLFAVVLDTQTWSPLGFEYPRQHGDVRGAAEAEGYRGLLPTMPGVPLDWVALRSDMASKTAREEFFHFPGLRSVDMFGLRRVISAPEKDGTVRITVGLWVPTQDPQDMTYESAKDAMCEVEQVWKPGELWWRSFRRLSHGQIELEATRISD